MSANFVALNLVANPRYSFSSPPPPLPRRRGLDKKGSRDHRQCLIKSTRQCSPRRHRQRSRARRSNTLHLQHALPVSLDLDLLLRPPSVRERERRRGGAEREQRYGRGRGKISPLGPHVLTPSSSLVPSPFFYTRLAAALPRPPVAPFRPIAAPHTWKVPALSAFFPPHFRLFSLNIAAAPPTDSTICLTL